MKKSEKKSAGIWVQATKPGYDFDKIFRRAGDKFQLADERLFSDAWMKRIDEPEQDQKSPEGGDTYEAFDRTRYGKFSNRNAPTPADDTRAASEKLDDAEKKAADVANSQQGVVTPSLNMGTHVPKAKA